MELFNIFPPRLVTPKGAPQELHTNLPDKARSALMLELPQTKHLGEFIREKSIQIFI